MNGRNIAPSAPPPLRTVLGRRFWALWIASTVSALGDGIRYVAFPLLAADLTRDPAAVALVFAAGYLPWPLLGTLGGAVADRADRARLMWRTDLVRGLSMVGLAGVTVVTDVPVVALAAASFVLGAAACFFDSAAAAMVPTLVPPAGRDRANSWLLSAQTVGSVFVGAPIAALLFPLGRALPLGAVAATFLIAALAVQQLSGRDPAPAAAARSTLRREIADGLRWLWHVPLLRTLSLLGACVNGTIAATEAVLVLYTIELLGLPPYGYSLLLAVLAVGAVAGTVAAPLVRRRAGLRVTLVGAALGQAAVLLLGGLVVDLMVVAGAFAAVGFASAAWNAVTVSLRQELVPGRLLGRVTSSYRIVGMSAMPVGALLGGFLADGFGLRAPFIVGAVVLAAATLLSAPWLRSR